MSYPPFTPPMPPMPPIASEPAAWSVAAAGTLDTSSPTAGSQSARTGSHDLHASASSPVAGTDMRNVAANEALSTAPPSSVHSRQAEESPSPRRLFPGAN